jgi:hypothetical protein
VEDHVEEQPVPSNMGENGNGELTVLHKDNMERSPVSQAILADPLNRYIPTPKEQDLLNILLDPFHRMSSITKICEMAKVSRHTYYVMYRKPEFQAYYRAMLIETVKQYGGQLVNIGIREARKGSFPHWKVLMEMGGLYNEKKTVEHEGETTMRIVFEDPDSADDE